MHAAGRHQIQRRRASTPAPRRGRWRKAVLSAIARYRAALAAGLVLGGCAAAPPPAICTADEIARGCAVTTELFLGLSRPDGSVLSEQEWRTFLTDTVTRLFPDGFAVLTGEGQWRRKSTGQIAQEPSRVLVIVHNRAGDDDRITALVTAYKKSFLQESVLRVDLKSVAQF